MKDTLISIITPCYNSQKYLDKMISSVISQTYSSWELIIVDDCSNDNSINLIEKFQNRDSRIILYKSKIKKGVVYARNKAISLAKGRFITFLDSDDYWEKNFLKYSIEKAKKYPFIFSSYNRINENEEYVDTINSVPIVNLDRILKGTPISCLSAFIDTNKYGKKFFPINAFREDLAYWIILLNDFKYAFGFNFCEANNRLHKGSSSSKKLKMAYLTWHDYRNYYNLPLHKSINYFVQYAFRGYLKYLRLKIFNFLSQLKK